MPIKEKHVKRKFFMRAFIHKFFSQVRFFVMFGTNQLLTNIPLQPGIAHRMMSALLFLHYPLNGSNLIAKYQNTIYKFVNVTTGHAVPRLDQTLM